MKNKVKLKFIMSVICGGLVIGATGWIHTDSLNQTNRETLQGDIETVEALESIEVPYKSLTNEELNEWDGNRDLAESKKRDQFAREVRILGNLFAEEQPLTSVFLPRSGIAKYNRNSDWVERVIMESRIIIAFDIAEYEELSFEDIQKRKPARLIVYKWEEEKLQNIKKSITEILPLVGYQPLSQDLYNVIGLVDYAMENKDEKALTDVDRIVSDLLGYLFEYNPSNDEYYGVTNTLENKATFTSDYQQKEVDLANIPYDHKFLKEKIEKYDYTESGRPNMENFVTRQLTDEEIKIVMDTFDIVIAEEGDYPHVKFREDGKYEYPSGGYFAMTESFIGAVYITKDGGFIPPWNVINPHVKIISIEEANKRLKAIQFDRYSSNKDN